MAPTPSSRSKLLRSESHSNTHTTTVKWRDFENSVASIYRAMGYKVLQNQVIMGQQIDIIAERYLEGIRHTRTVVECKFRSSGSVPNQDVYDFVHFFHSAKEACDLFAAVVVTNASFSAQAYLAAEQAPGFFLKTIQELEDSVFDLTTTLVDCVRNYETQPIFSYYVRLCGEGRTPIMPGDEHILDVELAISEWLMGSSIRNDTWRLRGRENHPS